MDKRNKCFAIYGGAKVHRKTGLCRVPKLIALLAIGLLLSTSSAFAQGSIYGSVANSDASSPANGDISFFGYLDDTDEEIRIESSTGAGYDAGHWFDDFQNYLTEAPNNPYDFHFYNSTNSEGYVLSGLIPSNSYQEENVTLATVAWPDAPIGLTGVIVSGSSVVIKWTGTTGMTYHVYRRAATSGGSFFRIDDIAGSLANPGVSDSFFVDNTVDGVSSYHYLVIAEDASGNFSPHSDILTVNSASADAPVLVSLDPNSGFSDGGTLVNVYGSGFDPAGVQVFLGAVAVDAIVLSPFHLTITTPTAVDGAVDVAVTNTASGLSSNTLTGGYTYVPNSTPVVADIPDQTIAEGAAFAVINLDDYVTDPDNADAEITWSYSGNTELTVDITDRVATITIPDIDWNGAETITFRATDPGELFTEDAATFTVTAENDDPVVADIPDQTVLEGATFTTITLDDYVDDIDNTDDEMTWTYSGNTDLTVDITDRIATITIPDVDWNGAETITFRATDPGLLFGEDAATFTVNAVNDPPVLAEIGAQLVTEGGNLNFTTSASDVENNVLTMTIEDMPTNATYADNGDGTAVFDFNPDYSQAGVYDVSFIVSDGFAADTEIVAITVNEFGNNAPVLDPIGPQTIAENDVLSLTITGSDPDGTIPTLSVTDEPTNVVFTDNLDGTASFVFSPDFTQEGVYPVVFKAFDGTLVDSEVVEITVVNTNQLPVLTTVAAQSVNEGDSLIFNVSGTDADGAIPTLSTSTLPGLAAFVDSLNGVGTFAWAPEYTEAGVYTVMFYATDGIDTDSSEVEITVTEMGNQPPEIDSVPPQTAQEGDEFSVEVSAIDPDGTIPTLTADSLPDNATFTDNGDGTGLIEFNPDYSQSGIYNVYIIADDGEFVDTMIVVIEITEPGNQAPVLSGVADTTISEGDSLVVVVTAEDPESQDVFFSVSTSLAGYSFVDSGNGVAVFSFESDYYDAGTRTITFFATDNEIPPATGSAPMTINITDVNQAPVIDSIGPYGVKIGDQLVFDVTASDDTDPTAGNLLAMTAIGVPTNASYVDNGDNTGTFTFDPDLSQVGSFVVTFIATDQGTPQLSINYPVTINVVMENRAPVVEYIGPKTVLEGELLEFTVTATDPDGGIPVLSLRGNPHIPEGATLTDNGDGTGLFSFTPNYVQAGLYGIDFRAFDGIDFGKETVMIQVYEAGNQTPIVNPVTPDPVMEGDTAAIWITSFDPDGTIPTLSIDSLPEHTMFIDSANGAGLIVLMPMFYQSGTYNIYVMADDGESVDTLIVTVTFEEAGNQKPEFTEIADRTVDENLLIEFNVIVNDPDRHVNTITAENLPGSAALIDDDLNDNLALFSWTTTYDDAGEYTVTFYTEDPEGLTDTIDVVITVENFNRLPRYNIATLPTDVTMDEGDSLLINIYGFDQDGPIPSIEFDTTENDLIENMAFIDSGNGSAVFTFVPDYTQSREQAYYVSFCIIDAEYPDTNFTSPTRIYVEDANMPPEIMAIDDTTIVEGTPLVIGILVDDVDPVASAITISTLPTGATFSDNGNNFAIFNWTPSYLQAGVYEIDFIATDGADPNLADTESVVITVAEAGNQSPRLLSSLPDTIPVIVNEENVTLLSWWDPEGETITISADYTPASAVFTDSGNGLATYSYTPNFSDLDVTFPVNFTAGDATGAETTVLVYFHVIEFLRGDANSDSELDISDIMYIYNFLYKDGEPPVVEGSADVNVDSAVNLLDGLYLLDYFFRQRHPPPND